MNIVCIICSDRLTPSDDVFYTPCGHTFHFACVTQWLERSRTCPQCREKVTQSKIHRLYFNFCNNDTIVDDPTTLQAKIDGLKFQLLVKERDNKQTFTQYEKCKKETTGLRAEVRKLENEMTHKNTAILALKEQTRFFKNLSTEADDAKMEVARLKKKLDELRSVQILVNTPNEEVDEMICNERDPAKLHTYLSVMKRELTTSVARRKELRTSLKQLQQDLSKVSIERNFLLEEHEKRKQLEDMLAVCECEKYELQDRLRKYENGTTSQISKNIAGRKNEIEDLTKTLDDTEDDIDDDETPRLLKRTSDVIDLSDDTKYERKIRPLKNNDVVVISPEQEHIRGNEENSPLSGFKYNISGALPKRKKNLITGKSAFSMLAKKPRLAQTLATDSGSSDMTFDGFGGHSKHDKFPSPRIMKKPSRSSTRKSNLDDGNNRKLGDFVNLDP